MELTSRSNYMTGNMGLPAQTVSSKIKQSRWWKQGCMDFFDYQSAMQSQEKYEIWRNYRVVNGDFELKDYTYVTDPLSMGKEKEEKYGTTMDIIHYPIMNRPIQTILGEYINRPLNYFVVNETDKARNAYLDIKTEMIQEWAKNRLMSNVYAKLGQQGVDPNSQEGQQMAQQMTPDKIQDYMDKDYIDVAEQVAQRMLKVIWRDESLDDEFLEGFKHAVISAREFYHIYAVNGRVKVKNLSPLDVFYQRSPNVRWISESQYAGFRLYLTPSSVIDLFYSRLKVKDIEALEAIINPNKQLKGVSGSGVHSIQYDTNTFSDMHGNLRDSFFNNNDFLEDMITNFQRHGNQANGFSTFGLIKVVQAYWKSQRKIGILTYYDEYDQPQKTIVDDNYVPDVAAGEYIVYQYINQVYQGGKIDDNIYLDIAPYTDTVLDIDRLDYCPLPIEGCTYNDTNSKPFSLVDLMRPWNELYNIVAYELRKDMNSSLGKVLFMSVDHIPDIPGFTWEKWYYWAKELKIAWVKQPARGANTFNQFSAADMSAAQQIMAKMQVLEQLKQECDSMAGFSPSRVAGQSSAGTLGESRQQNAASVNQTEYYFFRHGKLVERVLNHALNLCKSLEKQFGVMRNMFNDMEQAFIESDGDIANAKLTLYITNSGQDLSTKQKMEQLLNLAVSNGADVMDASEILMARTISESRNIFNSLRRKKSEAETAQRQHEQQMVDKQIQDKAEQREWDKEKHYSELDNNLQRDYIKTFGLQEDNMKDEDADGVRDILEFGKFQADTQHKNRDMMLKERKQFMDETFKGQELAHKNKELSLKNKEIGVKEKAIDASIKVASMNKNKHDVGARK